MFYHLLFVVWLSPPVSGRIWWKRRKTGQQQAYKQVHDFHDSADDAPWKRYSDHPRGESYELPNHEEADQYSSKRFSVFSSLFWFLVSVAL